MDLPQAPHREMVSPENRSILGTFNPRLIARARRSILRARDLEIPEKEEAVLGFMLDTAGLDGRAREDLRDAIMGARPQQTVISPSIPNAHRSNPEGRMVQPHL